MPTASVLQDSSPHHEVYLKTEKAEGVALFEEKKANYSALYLVVSGKLYNFAAMIAKRLIEIMVVGAVVLLTGCGGDGYTITKPHAVPSPETVVFKVIFEKIILSL